MILIAKLTKTVSFSLSVQDKEKLQQKAKELGIPLARLCRNILLEKYQNLYIGYIDPNRPIMKHDINIKKLRPPKMVNINSKLEKYYEIKRKAMIECINELKTVLDERKKIVEQEVLILEN